MRADPLSRARFRFRGELNDFLPAERRRAEFEHRFLGNPAVKDVIEGLGVPHPEVDLVVVNGESVGWEHHLADRDRVEVHPTAEGVEVSPAVRLRPEPPREIRFVLDVHLGRLARRLRLLGFDSLYRRDLDDPEIVELSVAERRIILTRDRGLLKHGRVTHGYWVRNTEPEAQTREIVARFDLRSFTPFTRCMECNGLLEELPLEEVAYAVPPRARERADTFHRCSGCGRVYWAGTHVERMRRVVESLRRQRSRH